MPGRLFLPKVIGCRCRAGWHPFLVGSQRADALLGLPRDKQCIVRQSLEERFISTRIGSCLVQLSTIRTAGENHFSTKGWFALGTA